MFGLGRSLLIALARAAVVVSGANGIGVIVVDRGLLRLRDDPLAEPGIQEMSVRVFGAIAYHAGIGCAPKVPVYKHRQLILRPIIECDLNLPGLRLRQNCHSQYTKNE